MRVPWARYRAALQCSADLADELVACRALFARMRFFTPPDSRVGSLDEYVEARINAIDELVTVIRIEENR